MELRNFNIYKNKLLNIVVIIIALIIAGNIYKNQAKELDSLQEKKSLEMKKKALLENIAKSEKRAAAYKNVFSKRDMSFIINKLTEMAKGEEVKIISIKPHSERDYTMYTKYLFGMLISAKDYHRLAKFISELENSPEIFMLEQANIRPQGQMQEEAGVKEISADITISTVFFKG